MKKILGLLIFIFSLQGINAQDFKGIMALTERVAPWTIGKIIFHSLEKKDNDKFEIQTQNNTLHISATSASAAGMGFNYYLNHFCNQSISRGADNITPLKQMPAVREKITIDSPFEYRFALNYCTFNYTMSFYQWKDWEKELDVLALHGVNLIYAMNGVEIIWKKTLEQFGFSDKEIKEFIAGPAYTAWWLMGNLEGWGGPVTDEMISRQMELQKKILSRMKELGIEPVLQGFYGMVPSKLQSKYPNAKIMDQGNWVGGFKRPSVLSPQDELFGKMADVFYQKMKEIYGDCMFFGGDLFHEGGKTEGIDVTLSVQNVQKKMQEYFPNSTWVLQGWQINPQKEVLDGLHKDHAIILDEFGENHNNWETRNAYDGTPWIGCTVQNFGGKSGLYGKLEHSIQEPYRALTTPQGKYMKGLGIMPEGITNNPLLYDLILNNAWGTNRNIGKMLTDYGKYRYGIANKDLLNGLDLLKNSVYISHTEFQEGCTESLFAARPAKVIKSVSTWGTRKLFYDPKILEDGLKSYLKAAPLLKNSKTYKYDVSDIARQVLANRGQVAYDSLMSAFSKKDKINYQQYKNKFLKLANLQEELMATDKNTLLGTWIDQAKKFGNTPYEKQLAEKNARLQITIWGPDNNPSTDLHEYAHKEWSGLIKDLYIPRWELFFLQLDKELAGEKPDYIDFFTMELNWANQQNLYSTEPKGKYLEVIKKITDYCGIK